MLLQKKNWFRKYLFNTPRFTPNVGLSWWSAQSSTTGAQGHTLQGSSSDRFSVQAHFRTYTSYSWRTIHLLSTLPIHPDSNQALQEPGDGPISSSITPKQLITFPSVSPCCLVAIVQEPLGLHISSCTVQMKSAELYEQSTPGYIIIFHLHCASLSLSLCLFHRTLLAHLFPQNVIYETVFDDTSSTVP